MRIYSSFARRRVPWIHGRNRTGTFITLTRPVSPPTLFHRHIHPPTDAPPNMAFDYRRSRPPSLLPCSILEESNSEAKKTTKRVGISVRKVLSCYSLQIEKGGEKWYYISSIITISIGRHLKKRPRKRCPLMFDDKSETLSAKGEWRGMKESGGRVGGWATARGFPTVDLFKWIDKSRCHLFLPPFLSLLSIRSNRPREQLGERFRKTLMSILLLAITFTRSYEK